MVGVLLGTAFGVLGANSKSKVFERGVSVA